MANYLVTWNSTRWNWPKKELAEYSRLTSLGRKVDYGWSTGNNRGIVQGDRIFLLKQGDEPRGLMASGEATGGVVQKSHWDNEKRQRKIKSNHVDIKFDTIIDPLSFPVLPVAKLQSQGIRFSLWKTRSGGVEIKESEAEKIEAIWRKHLKEIGFRTSPAVRENQLIAAPTAKLREAAIYAVTMDVHERNQKARRLCIDHWTDTCTVCGMTFAKNYGKLGNGFIHVHHLNPMAGAKGSRTVDPVNDLRPVCPNCHAMLHMKRPMLKIPELQAMLRGPLSKKRR